MRGFRHFSALFFVCMMFAARGFGQQPTDAFQSGSVTNLPAPASVDLSNSSSHDICVNTYVFDRKDNSFVSCCSSLVSPSQAYSQSMRLSSGTPGVAIPASLSLKLAATHPVTIGSAKMCNASPPTIEDLVTGMHASVNGVPFTETRLSTCVVTGAGQPCRNELEVLGLFCGIVQATGSGFGLCQSAVPVQDAASVEQKAAEMWHWLSYFN